MWRVEQPCLSRSLYVRFFAVNEGSSSCSGQFCFWQELLNVKDSHFFATMGETLDKSPKLTEPGFPT